MNSSVKNILIFMSGAAVGAFGMYFGVKKYFETKADLEISEVRRVYEDRVNEIEPHKSSIDGDIKGPEKIELKETVNRLNNKPDLTDYTKYFNSNGQKMDGVSEVLRDAKEDADKDGLSEEERAKRELCQDADVDPAEMEGPEDDEPYTDEEDRNQTIDAIDYQLNGASREAIENDKEPYEIDPSDYELTCSNYEKQSLLWYQFDEILADEDEEEVADTYRLIGNVLDTSGFKDNDVDAIYVRNDKTMVDYEITKIYEAFRPE